MTKHRTNWATSEITTCDCKQLPNNLNIRAWTKCTGDCGTFAPCVSVPSTSSNSLSGYFGKSKKILPAFWCLLELICATIRMKAQAKLNTFSWWYLRSYTFKGKIGWLIISLFHMTQLINRNNTENQRAIRNSVVSEHKNKQEHNGKITDQCNTKSYCVT